MRIPPIAINSVFYVYGSREAAENGEPEGGTGFLVAIPKREMRSDEDEYSYDPGYFVYAITNNHVIGGIVKSGRTPWLRFNSKKGGFYAISVPDEQWARHPEDYDLRAAIITEDEEEDYHLIPNDIFITQKELLPNSWHVGPGDTAYMIGRFVTHEGTRINTPVVRYGNIALNPHEGDKIPNKFTGVNEEVFLVESRSFSGYSGSPVFVAIPPYDDRSFPRPKERPHSFVIGPTRTSTKTFLLGVNVGHTKTFKNAVKEKNGSITEDRVALEDGSILKTEYNTGMMRVIPAWKLQELLNIEEFREQRENQ